CPPQVVDLNGATPEQCFWCSDRYEHYPEVKGHVECFHRAVLGSAAHQLMVCHCYRLDGHDHEGDLTRREAARLSYAGFRRMYGKARMSEEDLKLWGKAKLKKKMREAKIFFDRMEFSYKA